MELICIEKGEVIKKYNYFEAPTQVKFWDGCYIGGIAYRDEIICGCCGGIFKISDVYEVAPDTLDNDPIVVYKGWVGLSSEICGDDN